MIEPDPVVPPPPEARYPIIYKTRFGLRAFLVILGLIFLATGAAVAMTALTPDPTSPPNAPPGWAALVVGGVIFLQGLLCTGLGIFNASIRLTRGTIEIRQGFSKRWLVAEGIKGRRLVRNRGRVVGTALISRRTGEKPLIVARAIRGDAVLAAWVERFPDLDAADQRASLAAVTENPLYGATQAARQVALGQAKWEARAAALAALALAGLALAAPDSLPALALAALAPLAAAALAIQARGLLILLKTPNDARPDLSALLILPTLALFLCVTWQAAYFPDPAQFWPAIALSSAVLLVAHVIAEPALLRKAQSLALLFFTILHCGAVACLIDVRADDSTPLIQGTDVTAKYITHGKGGGPHLTLAAWEGVAGPQSIQVDWPRYNDAFVGQVVCVHTHPGWLGVPWYRLGHCNF